MGTTNKKKGGRPRKLFRREHRLRVACNDEEMGIIKGNSSVTSMTDCGIAKSSVVISVTGTSPLSFTAGSSPVGSMTQATSSVDGYLSHIDWTTFNGKQPAGTYLTPSSSVFNSVTYPSSYSQYGLLTAPTATSVGILLPSSWTSGHTFIPAYQPSGSPLAPAVIDLGSYIGSNVTASSPIVATSSTAGVSLSCPTCGTSSGGTNVSVNGGSSLGNLNINSMAPVADTSFLALTPKISGSNMIVESPYATSSQYGVTLVGASGGADAYGAAGARAGTGNCSSNQYETGDATGGPSCAQVAYSQVSGTPTIPYVPDIIAGNGSGGLKDTTIVSSANYSTLSAALTAIGSSVVTLDVSTPMSISGTVSVPLNISIKVEQVSGGAFTGSGSVTFSGPFSAGLYQVFPTAMSVTFANTGNIVEAVYPQWFGATANTVTDDHAAVQAALNAVNLASGAGSLVRFPTGTYNLGTTGITISQHNTRLVGEGRSVTQFLYSGTGSMITIDSVSGVAVEHMRLSLLSSGAAKIMSILTTTASVIDLRLNDLNIISATDPGKSGSVGLYIAPSGSNIFTSSFINDVHIVDFDSPIYEPGTGNIEGNSWSNIEVSDFGTSTTSLPVGVYANSNTDQWSNLRVAGAYGTTIPASATAYEQISGSDNTVVFSADIGSAYGCVEAVAQWPRCEYPLVVHSGTVTESHVVG